MTDIRKLMQQLAAQEVQLQSTQFLAPCVPGGKVQTRMAGIIYTFAPKPRDFEGWGIFQAEDEKTARLVEEPLLPQVAEYLKLLPAFRLRLAYQLKGQTWLAYPLNEGDFRQRLGNCRPLPIALTSEATLFEPVVARWDGRGWWFDEIDRRADPAIAETLRQHLKQVTPPQALQFKGMTREMQVVYDLVTQQRQEFQALTQERRDEQRLREALRMGGGELQSFRDRQDHWLVEWITAEGSRQTSAITKADLTVMSSGICLSGRDQDFDLQSLVGVIEQRFSEWD